MQTTYGLNVTRRRQQEIIIDVQEELKHEQTSIQDVNKAAYFFKDGTRPGQRLQFSLFLLHMHVH